MAYFDESGTHDGSPVMCVAGYLVSAEQAIQLDREWGEALEELKGFGVSCFHAADCAHGVEEFKVVPIQRRNELMKRLIGIIKRRVEIGIAVSISDTDFGRHPAPKWERGDAYGVAVLQAIGAVVAWAEKYSFRGEISYFFENGHRHQKLSNQAIRMLRERSQAAGSNHLRYHTHAFAPKRELRPLQAADLLAYEWQKELRRINVPARQKHMRRSLESLLERTHITQHINASQLGQALSEGFATVVEHFRRFEEVE